MKIILTPIQDRNGEVSGEGVTLFLFEVMSDNFLSTVIEPQVLNMGILEALHLGTLQKSTLAAGFPVVIKVYRE